MKLRPALYSLPSCGFLDRCVVELGHNLVPAGSPRSLRIAISTMMMSGGNECFNHFIEEFKIKEFFLKIKRRIENGDLAHLDWHPNSS